MQRDGVKNNNVQALNQHCRPIYKYNFQPENPSESE